MSKTLTIAIPTFNRPKKLHANLLHILEISSKYSIEILISDDSTDDRTKSMVSKLQAKNPLIHYIKNSPRLGHDKNIVQTLQIPKTDYVWLVGDSLLLIKELIPKVLKIVNEDNYDLLTVNVSGRNLDYESKSYDDCNEVLLKFGWHMTLTGATIYSQNIIASVNKLKMNKSRNFPHFSLSFHYLATKCSFFWINEILIGGTPGHLSFWLKDCFTVFIEDWGNAVRSLPDTYSADLRERVILRHSRLAETFSLRPLLNLRMLGIYNYQEYNKHKKILATHSGMNLFVLFMVSIIPTSLILIPYKFLQMIR